MWLKWVKSAAAIVVSLFEDSRKEKVRRSPLHQAAASPLQQPRKQPRFFSPESVNPQNV